MFESDTFSKRVKNMEKYIFSEQERSVMEGLQQAFAVYQFIDKRVVTLILSDGFCDMFGFTDRQRAYYEMDHDMYRATHPDDVARISNAAIRFAVEDGEYNVVYRTRIHNSPDYLIVHAAGKHVYTASGVRLAHVWYQNEGIYTGDSGLNKGALNALLNNALHEESLIKKSRFSYLTGLPGMTYFFELAEEGKKLIEEENGKPAMLFIDFSGMKYFNARNGFSEGDKLLQLFAGLLNRTFNNENCCHISGDHFAVLTREEGLEESLHRLFAECRELNGGNSLPLRVGIYLNNWEDVAVSVACDRAKIACDAMRNTFDSCFNYYSKDLREAEENRQYILTHIDCAIKEKWIKVYYQPIVRAVNGRVCDEEALARWIDPEKGFLSPACFIPYLEEAGKIYKLDLYMVDQVLEKLKKQKEMGFDIVPHSINFSRSDFDTCDLVEEVRRRVDDAGIPRNMITIEVTESSVGSDFDFMKAQIARFQELGFPVWMDDFGSGYSSLDVLSSIRFDLLKFDMIFMKRFNESENRKIVLTELMHMATSLGIDTVCEGVETEEQVHFLQEIGCSKLQGFYFAKPLPVESILERYNNGKKISYEDPHDSAYYEAMGWINLFDLAVFATEGDNNTFQNFFNTLPMAILEIDNGILHYVRSNPSYREFIKRFYQADVSEMRFDIDAPAFANTTFVHNIRRSAETNGRVIFDETMKDGSTVHALARRIVQDEAAGKTAVVVAVLSVTEPNEGTTYAEIARALAADYYNIYYVDLKTDRFIEYTSSVGGEELAVERHGEHFFEAAKRDVMTRIYEEDREAFLAGFSKENVLRKLDEHGAVTTTYRLIDTGVPMYVSMKISRMYPDTQHLIIGINIIDAQMKQHELNDTIQRETIASARIMALSEGYLTLYTVDRDTLHYYEYNATKDYKSLGLDITGTDFFRQTQESAKHFVYEEDLPFFLQECTKEKVLKAIEEKGFFRLEYRLMIHKTPKKVLLKIVPVRESDGDKLIVGVRLCKE